MMLARRDSRVVLITSIGGLVFILLVGGPVISVLEGVSVRDGLWMVFNVITAVGLGESPVSVEGSVLLALAFAAAAICYFWIAVIAVEVAMERYQHHALINEALRPLARRRSDRLHQDN